MKTIYRIFKPLLAAFLVVLSANTVFAHYDPSLGRWVNRDPIGEDGGINGYSYGNNSPGRFVDLFGLTPCGDFAQSLVNDFDKHESANDLGNDWLNRRQTTLGDTTGFNPQLTAGGQGGAVSRHIYGHAGAVMAYDSAFDNSPLGASASYINQAVDYFQRFQKGRSKAESRAEIAGDRAARAVARALRDAYNAYHGGEQKGLLEDMLRSQLAGILCNQ